MTDTSKDAVEPLPLDKLNVVFGDMIRNCSDHDVSGIVLEVPKNWQHNLASRGDSYVCLYGRGGDVHMSSRSEGFGSVNMWRVVYRTDNVKEKRLKLLPVLPKSRMKEQGE